VTPQQVVTAVSTVVTAIQVVSMIAAPEAAPLEIAAGQAVKATVKDAVVGAGKVEAAAAERAAGEKAAGNVTRETTTRATAGATDGAKSTQTITREGGDTISRTHTVTTPEGTVVHQHENFIGKGGGERQFPDEWTGTPTIDAPYENIPPRN
jgi:hypothetical protein